MYIWLYIYGYIYMRYCNNLSEKSAFTWTGDTWTNCCSLGSLGPMTYPHAYGWYSTWAYIIAFNDTSGWRRMRPHTDSALAYLLQRQERQWGILGRARGGVRLRARISAGQGRSPDAPMSPSVMWERTGRPQRGSKNRLKLPVARKQMALIPTWEKQCSWHAFPRGHGQGTLGLQRGNSVCSGFETGSCCSAKARKWQGVCRSPQPQGGGIHREGKTRERGQGGWTWKKRKPQTSHP